MHRSRPTYTSSTARMSERERQILRLVVRSFIETAGPIGSRFLSKRYPLGLSPASIRNTMSDLEELGYLGHPYTSAGRMPTELGYRAFVNDLMAAPELSFSEKRVLESHLEQVMSDTKEMFRESSRLLAQMSNLLGVVLTPKLSKGVLERIDVVVLSSSRVMFVISVGGGFVKTIVLEVQASLDRKDLDRIVVILNERLAGLTLEEVRRTCAERTRDLHEDHTGLINLIVDESATLFSEPAEGRLQHSGTQQIIAQPEFQETEAVRHLIALIENEGYIVRLLEEHRAKTEDEAPQQTTVRIGRENTDAKVEKYSIVTAPYQIGELVGTVGILGPMRMDYSRVVALVEAMASLLSRGTGAIQN